MKIFFTLLLTAMTGVSTSFAQPIRGQNPKYDPAHNPYEKVLEDTARGKRTAKFLKQLTVPELMKDKFYTSPCNEFAVLADARIEQFKEMVRQFQSMPSDPKQMKIAEDNYKKTGCAAITGDLQREIEALEKQGSYTGNANEPIENLLCRTKGNLQVLKNSLAYLEVVKKLFPATPGVDDAIKMATDGITKYGNNKALITSIKANKDAELAAVYFPKAVSQNTEMENWFKTWFGKNYPGYTYIKQALQSANWYIKKNEISGLPEYRQTGTAIGAKSPDGKCWIIKVDIYQDYVGSRFDESRFTLAEKKEILCENLK